MLSYNDLPELSSHSQNDSGKVKMPGAKQKHGLDRADKLLPGISKLGTAAAEIVDAGLEPSSLKNDPPICLGAVQYKVVVPKSIFQNAVETPPRNRHGQESACKDPVASTPRA